MLHLLQSLRWVCLSLRNTPDHYCFLQGRAWVSCCCIPTTNFSQFSSSHTQESSCFQSLHYCSFFPDSPTNTSMLSFLTSFMFSLKCHLARQTFNHSPLTLLYISSQYLFIYLFTGLLSVSPFSPHENRALFCSVLWLNWTEWMSLMLRTKPIM